MSTTFVLAGGCFWCLDAAYRALRGVESVVSCYTGGDTPHPSYEQVCTGATGHAEAVAVTFDETVLPPEVVLDAFFTMHDPTQLNRQGADVGTQYRSAMFYADESQRELFEAARHRAAGWWASAEDAERSTSRPVPPLRQPAERSEGWASDDRPDGIVTRIEPLGEVYPAEEYHQDFFAKNPTQGYCLAVAVPKVNKVRASFAEYLA